jgi:glycolate oxidase iron-sulfur subunit
MHLGIDSDQLNTCVQCGLCLSSCPTFRVTGDETMSPRGRIALMRLVQLDDAPVEADVLRAFESCVQCRGCEPACPSGVPYGSLIEQAKTTLASRNVVTPRWQRAGLAALPHPRLLAAGSTALAVAQRMGLVPKRLGVPEQLPLRRGRHHSSGTDVFLFTGCVMDVWQRDVHDAAQRVLESAGFGVTPTGALAPCCGALHAHAGLTDKTSTLASSMIEALDGTAPILVDSAGCGAAMKDYGHLLNTPKAHAFSKRVYDIHEFLAQHLDRLPKGRPVERRVAVQDPCHLRHVQKVHLATRTLLEPYVAELVELDDDGLCCGAGGAFSLVEPELAGQIRERKVAAIGRAQPDLVASANPGCSMHLSNVGVPTIHPMQLVDQALHGRR